jgi:hypothetical protein
VPALWYPEDYVRLEYFKSPAGNFGDDLNPWLWDGLLPGLLHEGDGDVLLGVGTILENWFADGLPLKEMRLGRPQNGASIRLRL